jgi:hypothetical protein
MNKKTRSEIVTKSSAFLVAFLCCFPVACLITYLLTLGISDFEGASGFAFVYLIIPITIITFFLLYLIRSKIFHKVIIFITVLVVLLFVFNSFKINYLNRNCLKHHIKKLQEPEKNKKEGICKKLMELPFGR